MIVAMAGLPGVGKSTLARALAVRLGAVVLDKDRIRDALFGPSQVDYSAEQNDFCVDIMYRTAAWLLDRDPARPVILDGRTYTLAGQVGALREAARRAGAELRIVECTCAASTALDRLAADRATGDHPAADRDADLYRSRQAGADPITGDKLVVDTDRPVTACVEDCLTYLTAPAS